jgi:hypothetical protein
MTKKERSLIIEASLKDLGTRLARKAKKNKAHSLVCKEYQEKIKKGILKPRPPVRSSHLPADL